MSWTGLPTHRPVDPQTTVTPQVSAHQLTQRSQGDVFDMQGRLSNRARPLAFTTVLWLCGVAVLFSIKAAVEAVEGPISKTWVDLTLVLAAYLFFFLLDPLQQWTANRLRKRARRKSRYEQTSS
jgi:hypothetical protein